jgi:hypothetical protein
MSDSIEFYPCLPGEVLTTRNTKALHARHYECGACGRSTHGRVLASLAPSASREITWAICSCEKQEPTILIKKLGVTTQWPAPKEFSAGEKWPTALAKLFEEATAAYAAGAYTASAMVARKILMACACDKGDVDGKTFVQYVDFITTTVLSFADAKTSIDAIRSIGNDANHDIAFVDRPNARRALNIIRYMLDAIYSLPLS